MAQKLGSVNMLVRRADGTLYGDNTDAFGFCYLASRAASRRGAERRSCSAAAARRATIQAVLEQLGART